MRGLDGGAPALLFDCDGLLVDTEPTWALAMGRVLEGRGVTVDLQALSEELTGVSVRQTVIRLCELVGEQAEAYDKLEAELLRTYTESVRGGVTAMPGAVALLRSLADRVPLAVVSNSPEEAVTAVLDGIGVRDLIDVVLGAHGTCRPKPDPEPYLRACELLGVAGGNCVAFEDSPSGAAAAVAAGLTVFVVPSPGMPPADFPPECRLIGSLTDVDPLRVVAAAR
jgi:HAD superfamily hydrolase (TIGR01509 family)